MRKPYRQGFNETTGDILVVCSPDDVQVALARNGLTIPLDLVRKLMRENEEALTYSYQHGWCGEWEQSVRDVLGDQVTEQDRTVKLQY